MASTYKSISGDSFGSSGGVTTFMGRVGAVIAAIGDYIASMIGFTPHGTIASTNVQTAIDELDDETQTHFTSIEAEIAAMAFTERMKILSGSNRVMTPFWLDFGTSDERVNYVEYTSTDVPLRKLVKTLHYTGSPGSYVYSYTSEAVVDA